jgi:TDG/mug DNA glycosylase family protein
MAENSPGVADSIVGIGGLWRDAHGELVVQSVGFDAVASTGARVLVLGSLPGPVSLAKRQYYAQPQNAFWKIMAQLLGFELALPYERRLAALKRHRVALWDVCASAYRAGALDVSIVTDSVRANDFALFFRRYRDIGTVFFNGGKAAALYKRLVVPTLPPRYQQLNYVPLPSTSPAYAAMPFAEKLSRWSEVRIAAQSSHTHGRA